MYVVRSTPCQETQRAALQCVVVCVCIYAWGRVAYYLNEQKTFKILEEKLHTKNVEQTAPRAPRAYDAYTESREVKAAYCSYWVYVSTRNGWMSGWICPVARRKQACAFIVIVLWAVCSYCMITLCMLMGRRVWVIWGWVRCVVSGRKEPGGVYGGGCDDDQTQRKERRAKRRTQGSKHLDNQWELGGRMRRERSSIYTSLCEGQTIYLL